MKKKIWKLINIFLSSNVVFFSTISSSCQKKVIIKTSITYDEDSLIQIKEFNIKGKPGIYFLGKKGLALLSERIKNEINYGPEIFGLKKIEIGDAEVHGSEAGVYYPISHEIFIGTDFWTKSSGKQYGFDTSETPDEYNWDLWNRVDVLFHTIFHEYGHYVADTYLNSIPLSQSYASRDIYLRTNNNVGVRKNWDKDFVDHFKSLLNYSASTEQNIENKKRAGTIWERSHGIKMYTQYSSIANIYDQHDLFSFANDRTPPRFNLQGKKAVFAPFHDPAYKLTDSLIIDRDQINYLFSLDELYTRKYQQLGMVLYPSYDNPYKSVVTKSGSSTLIDKDGWLKWSDKYASPTPFLLDTLKYQKGIFRDRNAAEKDRYLFDAPFVLPKTSGIPGEPEEVPVNKQLYDLMDRHLGHKDGADLSVIWNKNNVEIRDGTIDTLASLDDNLIKFGGYITSNEANKFHYVGIFWNEKFIGFPINTSLKYNFKYKDSLTSYERLLDPATTDNSFYVTKNFINANNIAGHQLFFAEDSSGKGAMPLTSVRTGTDGFVTSYRAEENATFSDEAIFNGVMTEDQNTKEKIVKIVRTTRDTNWDNI